LAGSGEGEPMIGRVNEVKVVPGSGWGVSASSGQISRVHGKGMPRVKDGDLRYAMACVSREFPNVSVSLDSIVPVPCDPTGKDLVEKLTNADDFFMTSYSRPKIQYEHPPIKPGMSSILASCSNGPRRGFPAQSPRDSPRDPTSGSFDSTPPLIYRRHRRHQTIPSTYHPTSHLSHHSIADDPARIASSQAEPT